MSHDTRTLMIHFFLKVFIKTNIIFQNLLIITNERTVAGSPAPPYLFIHSKLFRQKIGSEIT